MNSLFSLDGKTALITGASTGLGKSMALALAEAGANIVAVGKSDMMHIKNEVESHGRKFISITADLSVTNIIQDVAAKAIQTFGKIDILVNNAGIISRAPAIDFSEKDWDDVMNINTKSLFFLSQAIARDMMKRKYGKIINIASLLSFQGGIRVPSYAASKGAVSQLTKALANEWAKDGIRVNAIAPGYMITNNTQQLRNDASRSQEITARIPAGRWGTPEDLSGAVIFLASAASDYVNGHVLVVDGGWLAR